MVTGWWSEGVSMPILVTQGAILVFLVVAVEVVMALDPKRRRRGR